MRSLLDRWRHLSPPALFVWSFVFLVLLSAAGLLLIPGLTQGAPIGVLDALFTATSAVCVTGLAVVDTGTFFTFWGQLWILLSIQIGGLGLITLTTLIIGAVGSQLSLRSELLHAAPTGFTRDVRRLTADTARFTLGIELVGAVVLWALWAPRMGFAGAIWPAVFHSVSAFCNAGFSTFSDGLVGFSRTPGTLIVISALVVLGGLGYLVTEELVRFWRERGEVRKHRLSVHTYSAVLTSAVLLGGGAVLYLAFEWRGVLRGLPLVDRLVNAVFMSVTARTAGFNAVDYASLGNAAAFATMLLMFVGGSPGSTAGGVKTTSLAILVALARARIRGRRHVELHDRTVPEGALTRTVSLVLVSGALITVALLLLLAVETQGVLTPGRGRGEFLPLAFEAVSAFGTVGLSMGETATLGPAGKLVIVALMFLGRVGPLAFFAAVALRAGRLPSEVRAAREDLIVG